MKKIFKYLMGVALCFNGMVCGAVEKFEVLPDLPDPLAYAMPSAQASTISGGADAISLASTAQSVGSEPSMISVVMSLAIVILLIYLTGIIYSKLNKVGFKTMKRQNGDYASSHVSVLSTTQLGNNKTLHVVELDGKRMLIGASSGAIQLIKDLGSFNDNAIEEYSHIEIPNIKIPKIEIPKIEIPTIGLSKLMTKTHKAMDRILEETNVTSKQEETKDVEQEEQIKFENQELNQEGIIDTLFAQQDVVENVQENKEKLEHVVDPEDFGLYKKYLS